MDPNIVTKWAGKKESKDKLQSIPSRTERCGTGNICKQTGFIIFSVGHHASATIWWGWLISNTRLA